MNIEINQKLKESILKTLPPNYSNLEKAVYIYQQLCLKTEYAMDYYLEEEKVKDNYRDVSNLSKVDGEGNKDVVCFTFNAIYLKLLVDAGVIDEQQMEANDVGKSDKLSSIHQEVVFDIDGHEYSCDSTYGVLDNNDLALLKYSCNKMSGFLCYYDEEGQQLLEEAIKKVQAKSLSLSDLSKRYNEIKEKEGEVKNKPLSERVDMFLRCVQQGDLDYSMKSFTHLLKLKQILFTGQELGKESVTENIDLVFTKDVKDNEEYKAFLFFNDLGYVNDLGYENFDKLRVFEISLKDQQVKEVSVEDVRERCKRGELRTRDNKHDIQSYMKLIQRGRLKLDTIFEGEPKYDRNQKPINVAYYVRTHILTGEKEKLSQDQINSMEME